MEFEARLISEIGEVIGGGTPKTSNDSYYNGDIPWITPKDLSGYDRIHISEGSRNISQKGLENSSARLLPKNTILMSSRAPIGYLAIAENELTTNQGFKSIVCDESQVNPYYLYYYLKANMETIKNLGTGSTFSEISGKVVKNIEVKLPSLNLQNKIMEVLLSIDKKIDINQKIIANLEELSQTLFKRWFIDFEFPDENGNPYKLSGGDIVETHLGLIPPQWEICTLNQVGSITGGATPSKKIPEYYTTPGISWITPKDLSNNKNKYIYSGETDISELGLQKSSAKLMPRNTVLFSSRAPIGYIALAGKEVTTNQGFKSIVPDKGYSPFYIYFLLKEKLPTIEQAAGGSTFKEISGKGLKQIEIYLPPKKIVDEYHSLVKIYFEKINNIELENKSLTKLRDTLLPKLISGELELPEALEV